MDSVKIIDNFMYYFYNKWNEYEAEKVFGRALGKHIYEKYLELDKHVLRFYGSLDKDCRNKLVDRVNEVYSTN